jgi:hypothetical protein
VSSNEFVLLWDALAPSFAMPMPTSR